MRDRGQNVGQLALDHRPLGRRRPVDRRLDLANVLRKLGDQRVERCFVLGHVDGSVRLNLTATGKDGAGPLERLGHVFEIRTGRLRREPAIDQSVVPDGFQCGRQVSTGSLALDWGTTFVAGLVDFIDLGAVGRDAAIQTTRRLKADPMNPGRLDHRLAKGVVVEVMILPEKEHFAILAAAVQNDMRMWMRAILVYCSNIVELRPLTLKELLADRLGDIAHLFTPGPNRECHQQMRRMAKLGAVALVPLVLEPPRHSVDLGFRELLLPVMGAAAVEDMGRLRREICELRP